MEDHDLGGFAQGEAVSYPDGLRSGTMASMKPGDRVKHSDGRRGTILPGGFRRPSPADDPEPDSVHTHWDIKWDTTGVDPNPVRAKDLQVLYKFSDSDLQFIGADANDPRHIEIGWKVPDGKDFSAKLTLQQAAKFWTSLDAEVEQNGTHCSIEHNGVVYQAEMATDELESFANQMGAALFGRRWA